VITFTLLQAFCRYLANEIQHRIMHYARVQYILFLSKTSSVHFDTNKETCYWSMLSSVVTD